MITSQSLDKVKFLVSSVEESKLDEIVSSNDIIPITNKEVECGDKQKIYGSKHLVWQQEPFQPDDMIIYKGSSHDVIME